MTKEILLGSVLLVAAAISARADETGMAGIHEWRKEAGKTCLSDHFHDGVGTGISRKDAEAKAIASWQSFTIWEYGTTWGSYRLAGSRKMDCTQAGVKDWSCAVSARACKAGSRGKRK
jgi:hypothetical protein